jgi:hypothetical protein
VHSPYVYSFVDTVLLGDNSPLHDKLVKHFGKEHIIEIERVEEWSQAVKQAKGSTVIILPGIHRSVLHSNTWMQIANDPAVRVSMDIYQYGILLFSEGFKEKQHFVLKNKD